MTISKKFVKKNLVFRCQAFHDERGILQLMLSVKEFYFDMISLQLLKKILSKGCVFDIVF